MNQLVDESEMSSINFSQDEKEKKKKQRRQREGQTKGHNEDEDRQQSNTIMQQINNFSLTPMNDVIAEKTIEDHKYLLELVENRCAISYFAAVNRNQSLYFALKKYHTEMKQKEDDDLAGGVMPKKRSAVEQTLEASFDKMIQEYDFMSIIMYPEL
jgi:hypothetical protein